MKQNEVGVLEQLAREALDLGAATLEVEYRDGHEEVVAYIGALGREIARLQSGTPQASALRQDLYATKRRLLRFNARGQEYGLRADVYENFGEDAFRVELRALTRGSGRSNDQKQSPLAVSQSSPTTSATSSERRSSGCRSWSLVLSWLALES